MALSDHLAAVVAVLRRRPGDLLPLYLLGAAVPAIIRVVPFFAALVGYLHLRTSGRLATVQTELADLESPPDPQTNPDAFDRWAEGLVPVFEQVLTPTMLAIGLVTVLLVILLAAVVSPYVTAGQLAASYARLRDERGVDAGFAGARRHWLRFLGLYLLEFLLWAVLLLGGGIAVVIAAGGLSAAGVGAVGILVGLLVGLLLIVALAAVRALFAFAPVAVVVDDVGVFASLSRTASFVRAYPGGALAYYVLSLGVFLGFSALSGVLALVEIVVFPSLLGIVLLFPALDLLKTSLYGTYRGRLRPPTSPDRSLQSQVGDGLRRGWAEMVAFVRSTPGTHALVLAVGLGSFAAGWYAADPYAGVIETSIASRLEGHVPPAAALEFFGNNWLVAITTVYSGVAFVVPAVVSVLFNGLALGITARLEVAPLELLAFVVPHGVIEIPAILIAGALGVSVGVDGWRTLQGRMRRATFADRLERAFWVLVGIGILLAVAGAIEGFVSPYYYRPFL
ncbi:stage II sporulation protein M [Halopiger aswanensis]|uniref:Stage II sporulation protein M n=1 Tax=Halopiger aswanensis TaxID=148449 RepID=A0A3R7DD24_9EURY|nr:stage II sporulation protein M [Halopiger aswanensis]RKD98411.1 stage II sporulation protein M [Halopiger aswanensis]